MGTSKQHDQEERLSQLLKMKRQERPDAEFWKTFDQNLRSRQLSALVRTQSWRRRGWKLASILARKSAPTVATASAFTLAFFAVSKSDLLVDDNSLQTPAASADMAQVEKNAPIFVVESNIEAVTNAAEQTISANQVYTVQALTRTKYDDRYRLIASPKAFTAPQNGNELSSFGAKVIRTENQF